MVAPEDGKQWIWNEGWPQPAANEKGTRGGDVKGGHKILVPGEQLWEYTKGESVTRKMKVVEETAAGDGRGGMVVEPKWEM